jgi:hypothetical protein
MRLNKKVFKSNNFKNEYIDHSGFLHTSNRSYSVNHKNRNGIDGSSNNPGSSY